MNFVCLIINGVLILVKIVLDFNDFFFLYLMLFIIDVFKSIYF